MELLLVAFLLAHWGYLLPATVTDRWHIASFYHLLKEVFRYCLKPLHYPSDSNLALIIGNSRLHWGYFYQRQLLKIWHTPHLEEPVTELPIPISHTVWVYIVSVVPEQTQLWEAYSRKTMITRDTIPLRHTYNTLGSDRALCAYGAGETYGYPALVIDGGTALTYTAVGKDRDFLGGAILPGLRLQVQALAQQTAALPEIRLPDRLPSLWATSTPSAIASGILHTFISGIKDYITAWWEKYPEGVVVFTGGDATILSSYLAEKYPALSRKIIIDETLMFQGMIAVCHQL